MTFNCFRYAAPAGRALLVGVAASAGLSAGSAAAQEAPAPAEPMAVVTGRVLAAGSGAPLEGILVEARGVANGVLTDATGRFELPAPVRDLTLRFSGFGYRTHELPVARTGSAEVLVRLEADAIVMNTPMRW